MALTTDTVADAAMRILADFGLGDLTMRRLARELGVQPSALYWHVADKQSLFVLLAERMAAEADAHRAQRGGAASELSLIDDLAAYRQILLRYRESADIVLLAYAHSGATVLPRVLAQMAPECREVVTPFVLGCIAVQQTRQLFTGTAPVPRTESMEGGHGYDAGTAFHAGLARLLEDEKRR